eukprot:1702679-Ditylum_brightwellii.AAC.1
MSIISGVTVNNNNEHKKHTSISVELTFESDDQTHDEKSVISAINDESDKDNNEEEEEGSTNRESLDSVMNGTRNLKLNPDNKDNDNISTMLMTSEIPHPTQQEDTDKDNQSTISGITVEYTQDKGMIQEDNNEQGNQSTIWGQK